MNNINSKLNLSSRIKNFKFYDTKAHYSSIYKHTINLNQPWMQKSILLENNQIKCIKIHHIPLKSIWTFLNIHLNCTNHVSRKLEREIWGQASLKIIFLTNSVIFFNFYADFDKFSWLICFTFVVYFMN